MRMWMVDPEIMCRKHLLGEHVECHMFVGTLRKKKKVDGYFKNDLFEPTSLFARHEQLSREMQRRGYKHNSLMDSKEVENLIINLPANIINVQTSLKDLIGRCPDCLKRFQKLNGTEELI